MSSMTTLLTRFSNALIRLQDHVVTRRKECVKMVSSVASSIRCVAVLFADSSLSIHPTFRL